MADLKKLAQGRKGFQKGGGKIPAPSKPAKKLAESCAEEVGEVEAAFRNRLAKEDKRKVAATDSEFWFAVYFQTREEKERFLRDFGLGKLGDKYLSGSRVSRVLKGRSAMRVCDSHKDRR